VVSGYDVGTADNSYWESIGGTAFLPGTVRAADRFARASFVLKDLPRQLDPAYSDAVPGQPNLASTIWRVIHDQSRRVVMCDAVTSPSVFWVSLDRLDLRSGASVRRLRVAGGQTHAGETAGRFEPATPFSFLPASGPLPPLSRPGVTP